MDLIERYVSAVGRRLPANMRRDVETELKSLIMDELDNRVPAGSSYTEQDVVAVLEKLGRPEEVAVRYSPYARYVIGPQLYDTYLLVLKIVLGVAAFGIAVGVVVGLATNKVSGVGVIWEYFTSLLSGAMGVFGSVTLIFAILERTLPDAEKEALRLHDKWDPRKLPAIPSSDRRVKISDSVVAICFGLVALFIFNFFSDRLGGVFLGEEQWTFIPFLDQTALKTYLPYWNTVWIATVIHHVVLLAKREWTITNRIFAIALSGLSIAVLAFMLRGPSLITAESFLQLPSNSSAEDLQKLGLLFEKLFRFGLFAGIIGATVDIAMQLYRLVKAAMQP